MCRNIRTLFNLDAPATEDEIRASPVQFVRKISGFTKPSRTNETAFEWAVEEVMATARVLLASLETKIPPKDRDTEAAITRARAQKRFAVQL